MHYFQVEPLFGFQVEPLPQAVGQFASQIGTKVEAGLPNITGHAGWFNIWRSWNTADIGGAFYTSAQRKRSGEDHKGDDNERPLMFNANRCSSIYGNSSTVTPPSVKLLPCMKL